MKRRAAIGWLTGAMLFSVSCSILPRATPHGASPLANAAPEAPAAAAAEALALEVASVRAVLAERRTNLAAAELDALARDIVREAHAFELDTALVLAVMHVESRFDVFAVSPVGALGIMQIMPATGRELAARYGVTWRGPATLFDPSVNVKLGIAYLRELSLRYDDVPAALAAYNWGPGAIDGRLRRGHGLPTEYPELVNQALARAQRERRS